MNRYSSNPSGASRNDERLDGIIRLTESQRKSALEQFRFGANARISRRAHILLLLDQGLSYRTIMEVIFCGSDTVADVKRKFQEEGLESALGTAKEVGPAPEWSDKRQAVHDQMLVLPSRSFRVRVRVPLH
jgi:hypothetical protein